MDQQIRFLTQALLRKRMRRMGNIHPNHAVNLIPILFQFGRELNVEQQMTCRDCHSLLLAQKQGECLSSRKWTSFSMLPVCVILRHSRRF